MDEGCGVLSDSGSTTFVRRTAIELLVLVPLNDFAEFGQYERGKLWENGLIE